MPERWSRAYERLLQVMVWSIVLCFGWVVVQTGVPDWGALWRGLLAFDVPGAHVAIPLTEGLTDGDTTNWLGQPIAAVAAEKQAERG